MPFQYEAVDQIEQTHQHQEHHHVANHFHYVETLVGEYCQGDEHYYEAEVAGGDERLHLDGLP